MRKRYNHWGKFVAELKGRILINKLNLHYTNEMDRALQGAHKVNYEVYSYDFSVRLEVERKREADYTRSMQIVSSVKHRPFTK